MSSVFSTPARRAVGVALPPVLVAALLVTVAVRLTGWCDAPLEGSNVAADARNATSDAEPSAEASPAHEVTDQRAQAFESATVDPACAKPAIAVGPAFQNREDYREYTVTGCGDSQRWKCSTKSDTRKRESCFKILQ